MRRPLRYSDAVKMLDGGESKLISFLDAASSGVLAGFEVFDLFEAKGEAVRLADKALKGLKRRLSGLDALTRSERLAAAHWIIVVTAFFEAAEEQLKAIGINDLGASASEQAVVITEVVPSDRSLLGIASAFIGQGIPDIERFYDERSYRFVSYVSGLAVFESLSNARREAMQNMQPALAATALLRYEERLRELAGDCAEFGIWLNLSSHARARDAVREIHMGLVRLESLLPSAYPTAEPGRGVRNALSLAYRAALDKPITQQASSELEVPTLGEGYIDHRFRIADRHPTANPAQDEWWRDTEPRDDLGLYLAAYFVSDVAHAVPMLVLGHPGSGKSVLTRVLAARLPTDRFLPIRVELRSVDADADLQTQIEEAIRQSTGESVRWPDLVRSAPEVMPVVLLDGFDELLQATGVTQTDFLERVSRFQERERDQGRAVAVLITSRIAVADRARIPADTTVMSLEPFNDRQVKAWLAVWTACNKAILARRGLLPLSAGVALMHPELAVQPLMLLMLALYDASANGLGGADEDFDQTALYEALLTDFARREIEKEQSGPADDDAVELELARLSVVAFAMFNRRAQWATDEDVTADLTGLRMASAGGERHLKKNLTAGQLAVGRFFFIHDTRATRDGVVSQTYEFLHATFGEFLMARFVTKLITALAEVRSRASTLLPSNLDDGWLHALLSFECLAARTPIVEFLTSLVPREPQVTDLLLELFSTSLDERSDSSYSAYRPLPLSVVRRHANWSANLMLLAAISADGITASRLFGSLETAASDWRDTALLWRGQLSVEGRNGLIRVLHVERIGDNLARDVFLHVDSRRPNVTPIRLEWTYDLSSEFDVMAADSTWSLHRKTGFSTSKSGDLLLHAIEPLTTRLPTSAHLIIRLPGRPAMTLTHALLNVLAALDEPGQARRAVEDLTQIVDMRFPLIPAVESDNLLSLTYGVLIAAIEAGVTLTSTKQFAAMAASDSLEAEVPGATPAQVARSRLAASLLRHVTESQASTTPTPPASEASPPPSPSPAASSPEMPATPPVVP